MHLKTSIALVIHSLDPCWGFARTVGGERRNRGFDKGSLSRSLFGRLIATKARLEQVLNYESLYLHQIP